MLPFILAAAIILILLFIVTVGQPTEFIVIRSAKMNASPQVIFSHVNDLHQWEDWSPWAKIDPNAKTNYDGSPEGVGASFAWAGNNKIGEGKMTITESSVNELVRIRLEFLKPFKATNTAEFTFRPENGQTIITWSMFGKSNFASKVFGLLMNCEKMCGCQFEKGLAQLNSAVQAKISG